MSQIYKTYRDYHNAVSTYIKVNIVCIILCVHNYLFSLGNVFMLTNYFVKYFISFHRFIECSSIKPLMWYCYTMFYLWTTHQTSHSHCRIKNLAFYGLAHLKSPGCFKSTRVRGIATLYPQGSVKSKLYSPE